MKIMKLLLDKGADFNIQSHNTFPAHFPIIDSFMFRNIEATRLLLKYDIDFTYSNSFLDTIGHNMFLLRSNYPLDIKREILDKTIDINQKNVDGDTILHLLLKYHNWKDYEDILSKKLLDIFTKNKKDTSPLKYIKKEDINKFISIVADGFIYFLENNDITKYKVSRKLLKCHQNMNGNTDKQKCIKLITNKLKDNKNIIFKVDDEKIIDINKNDYAKYVLFIGNSVRLHMKVIDSLKKYKELGIPYLKETPKQTIGKNNTINKINDTIKYIPELYHFELLWLDEKLIIPDKFNEAVDNSISKSTYNFILISLFIKLSIHKAAHQNILIYDIKNNILERFNSMGDIDDIYNYKKLDTEILKLFKQMKTIDIKTLKYIKSVDNIKNGPQLLSHEKDVMSNVKISDPGGFCLMWAFWYLEMRLRNRDILPPSLIKKANNKILHSEYTFTEYIRNYTKKISDNQNKLLQRIGISGKDLYDSQIGNKNMRSIYKYLRKSIRNYFT